MIILKFEITEYKFNSLKDAYKYFMSFSRFLISKQLSRYTDCSIYINGLKKYDWIYCEELKPDFDTYAEVDDDLVQIVFCPGEYSFVCCEVGK